MSRSKSKTRSKSKSTTRSKSKSTTRSKSKSTALLRKLSALEDTRKSPILKRVKLKTYPGSEKWTAPPGDTENNRKKTTALLIIDVQNDFLSNGSLAVPNANHIIPKINKLRKLYDVVVLSQDWHPPGHVSFGSSHGAPLFTMMNGQMMWPDHCVQNTAGAKIHKDLNVKKSDIIIKKGTDLNIDAYSAFFDNNRKSQTKLHAKLSALGIRSVDVCGLAYDYCVGSTALDAKSLGYTVRILKPATASVSKKSEDAMTNRLKAVGVMIAE